MAPSWGPALGRGGGLVAGLQGSGAQQQGQEDGGASSIPQVMASDGSGLRHVTAPTHGSEMPLGVSPGTAGLPEAGLGDPSGALSRG